MKLLLGNSRGISLPIVLLLVGGAVGSIGYIAMNLLPKLQEGQKKAEQAIHYKIFVNSLNDYMVHAIRERWCINASTPIDGISQTDLLLSNECGSTKPLEEIVTFPGNLERILWDNHTIGDNGTQQPITILGLNYLRRQPVATPPGPPKTSIILTKEQVSFPDNKITYRITETAMGDMSNEHPLYKLTQNIKSCFNFIDIEVSQLSNGQLGPQGEEKKIRLHIKADLKQTRLSCLAHKVVQSVSFYTFYPRRLHNFSLIKYGDLDASEYHEFHGPVYLAGNLKLPATAQNKQKSTIFYDTLTLGTYNGGSAEPNRYEAGKIVTSDNAAFTFEDRGHPYKSKQNDYETFRGILGGLRLDAVEDKGLYNLFDYSSTNNADVASLEACVEENKIKTKPSLSSGSVLAYSEVNLSTTSNPGAIQFKMGINNKNRFKPSLQAPSVTGNPNENADKKFIINVPQPPNGSRAIGEMTFVAASGQSYSATIGDESKVEISIDLEKFALTSAILDSSVSTLNTGVSSKASYQDVIPSGHVLRNLAEYSTYKNKAENLLDKCDQNHPSIAHCKTPFPSDYASVVCDHTQDPQCDKSNYFNDYMSALNALKNKLIQLKAEIDSGATPTFSIEVQSIQSSNKLVINQKVFSFKFTSSWKAFFPVLGLNSSILNFTPYHYSNDSLSMRLEMKSDSGLMGLQRLDNNNSISLQTFSGWKNLYDNTPLSFSHFPEILTELDCPTGMGFADWNIDMSGSTNFAWNYANTPPGVSVDVNNHYNLTDVPFTNDANFSGHLSGLDKDLTKSVVIDCTVKKTRKFVYGFYACKNFKIEGGRSTPLYLIGTFIINNIDNQEAVWPVYWHSMWTPAARDLVMTELNSSTPLCQAALNLTDKTFSDIVADSIIEENINKCSSQELVSNGPNNFTWTTVDPEIGIDPSYPTMTSQKVKRHQRWVIREDSRKDLIK